ncbi:hypothetical protein AB0878_36230 [Amycolatopsis sp. NPDC047767]|uniref:hypothetical protein n=1 Tax=Amycolatopsis sp. NPDC047767 TaxID=3156765 RepID=UPI003453B3E5
MGVAVKALVWAHFLRWQPADCSTGRHLGDGLLHQLMPVMDGMMPMGSTGDAVSVLLNVSS